MPETDVDLLRELLHRATDDLHAPPAATAGIVTRHHRRLRNTRMLSITTTGVAAAAVAAAVVVTSAGPSAPSHPRHPVALPPTELLPVKSTAVQVLDQLSVAARRAPQLACRYIALTEIDPTGLLQRTSVLDGLTGNVWVYQRCLGVRDPNRGQRGCDVPGELYTRAHWSPTRAEFAAWPTDPARLRALILSKQGQATEEGQMSAGGLSEETPDDLVFQEATDWLWNPLLSPALRSAMYKVLAATPGVEVKTGTTDMNGRPAIEISRQDSITGVRVTTFQSPSTGAVLEQDSTYGGPAVYVAVTGYDNPPANPYTG